MASKLATLFSLSKKKEKKTEAPQDPASQLELEFAKLQLTLEKTAKPCKHCKAKHPPGTSCRKSASAGHAQSDSRDPNKLDATRMRSISSIRSIDSDTMYSPASTPIGSLRLPPRTPTSPTGVGAFLSTSRPLETIFSSEPNSSGESTPGSCVSGSESAVTGVALSPQARRRGDSQKDGRNKNRLGGKNSPLAFSQSADNLSSPGMDRVQTFTDMARANTDPGSTKDQSLDWGRMASVSSSSSPSPRSGIRSPTVAVVSKNKERVKGGSLRNSPLAYRR